MDRYSLHVRTKMIQSFAQAKQRVPALFLFALFTASIVAPPASAIAAAIRVSQPVINNHSEPLDQPTTTSEHSFRYPGAPQAVVAAQKAAADTYDAGSAGPLSKTAAPAGQVLQGLGNQPAITPHELTDRRTATSTQSVNADGSITQTTYFASQFFKKDGGWADIDTTLVEDKNAGDSGNIFGKALGQVESWFASTRNFTVKANEWQARFSPSDFDKGMVRIQQGGSQIGYVPLDAATVAPVIITNNGAQLVQYSNLWPGVDVQYIVEPDSVKENIILKDRNAANQISFRVVGATLSRQQAPADEAAGYAITDALGSSFAIAAPSLMLNNFGPATEPGVLGNTYQNDVLTVSVDKSYLASLPDKAFPAVIDPTTFKSTFGTRSGGTYKSFKSDGYVCSDTTCNPYAGSVYDSNNVLRYWRGAIHVPYDQFKNSANNFISASLHLAQRTNAGYWTGTYDTHTFAAGRATCTNSFNCINSSDGTWGSASFATSGNINVTNAFSYFIAHNDFNGWLMIVGEDGTTSSFKDFDPGTSQTYGSYVTFTYGGPPPPPSIARPTNNQIYVDPQPSFSVDGVANPNGSTPLQYQFLVSSGLSGTGALVTSPVQNATQWTIPDNILQDGATYYIQARSYDAITGTYSGWGTSVAFRIDMRTGKDTSQVYDTLGPVSVDLATGNLSTNTATHGSAALGGNLGVDLTYNSPLRSRSGLVGRYWNVATNYAGGLPGGSANLTRVDQNIDFDWNTGSPSAGTLANDWYYAAWDGYFVAPASGTYYFGGSNDDLLKITVNGQLLYSSTICSSGVCYGSAVTLQAGQAVPFHAEYQEKTGTAYAHMYIKGAVDEQVLPADWLQTGVRPIAGRHGLTGSYFARLDGTNTFSANNYQIMQRVDPYISFNWGSGPPVPNGPNDFLVRWSGYVTVPVTGTYNFGSISDDGSRITVGTNNTMVLNDWTPHSAPASPTWGSGYTLTANTPTRITIEFFDSGTSASYQFWVKGAVAQQIVPADWLSPDAQVLPDGWKLGAAAGGASYVSLQAAQNSTILTDSGGGRHEYTWTGSGYRPPVNEDGQLLRNADGTFTLQDADGRTYIFNTDGTIASVTSAADDRNPAALQYEYQSLNGGPPHLYRIKDGIDPSRTATLYYSGQSQCGNAPSGFDPTAPAGMLCALTTNDGRVTYLYYKTGQLTRITRPGNDMTEYGYEAVQNANNATIGYRIVSVRDSLAMDAVAAGKRADDDTTKTQIVYDSLGRAVSVTQPAPAAGTNRLQHTIAYLPGAPDKSYYGMTDEHVTGGSEPNGFSRRVAYDHLFRTIKDTDIAGLSSTIEWDDNKDLVYSTTDPTGRMSTTVYDDEDRPTASYGPAPAAWFDTTSQQNQVPLPAYAGQVPKTASTYDAGITGPAVTWFDYTKLSGNTEGALIGAPKLHQTGVNTAAPGILSYGFASPPVSPSAGAQGIGLSASGKLRLPNGTYTISADTSDGIRVWVDDQLVLNSWADSSYHTVTGTAFTVSSGAPQRFRADIYRRTGSSGTLNIKIAQNGGFGATTDWSSYLKPDYSLPTGAVTSDSTLGDTTATISYGANPELGLAQSATVDPSGLNLTTATTYEQPGASGSFLRKTSQTLPGSPSANPSFAYTYYGATETRQNPCNTVQTFKQAGMLKLKTEASPDGGTNPGRKTETVYDDAGRVIASRYNADNWTCLTYDSRGRVSTTAIPAFNGEAGRTVSNDYAVSGDPLEIATWDDSGTVATWTDLLGNTVKYRDVHNDETTTTYDDFGRLTQRVSPAGTETYDYDTYNRLSDIKLDGTTYATISYDQYDRVDHISYNNASQMGVNFSRDSLGRTNSLGYTLGDGNTTLSDTASLTQSSRVQSDTVQSGSSSLAQSFSYDGAGRLTGANVGPHTYSYGFGTQDSSCGTAGNMNANAGKNGNRTSQTIDGNTTYFCYDYADRLVSSGDSQVSGAQYDSHGNMTNLGSTTFGYDSSDRNTSIIDSLSSVGYMRDVQGRIVKRTVSGPSASSLPNPWVAADVGSPAIAGSAGYDSGVFTVNGAGEDVWDSSDQFQFVHQPLTGDGQIIARVTGQTDTNDWAKAGIVIKASDTSGSNYASIHTTPGHGVRMQYNYSTDIDGGSYTFPNVWLKLVRSGSTITTYKSSDGSSWTAVGSTTMSLPATALIGLYVSSVNGAALGMATFDNVSVTGNGGGGSGLPSGWANQDIGNPITAGSTTYSNGVFTVNGAGYDVWHNGSIDDQFQFAYKPLTGNGQIVARITSQTNTNDWAKAGIVIKDSTTSGSSYAAIMTTPSEGIRMEYNFDTDIDGGSYSFPNAWLKLVRTGDTITTYKSGDGTTWTEVGTATVPLSSTALIGVYVSSVNDTTLSTATFDNISVTGDDTSSSDYYYGYTSSSDSPDFVRDANWNIIEKYIHLPGGILLTIHPQLSGNAQKQYSLPSLLGRTLLTTDAAGTNSSTGSGPLNSFMYDPFGNPISATDNPANANDASYGYGGSRQKFTETTLSLAPIQMGARVYLAVLGRFTAVDPVQGGTANSYVYVLDPVNESDYTGQFALAGLLLLPFAPEAAGAALAATAIALVGVGAGAGVYYGTKAVVSHIQGQAKAVPKTVAPSRSLDCSASGYRPAGTRQVINSVTLTKMKYDSQTASQISYISLSLRLGINPANMGSLPLYGPTASKLGPLADPIWFGAEKWEYTSLLGRLYHFNIDPATCEFGDIKEK